LDKPPRCRGRFFDFADSLATMGAFRSAGLAMKNQLHLRQYMPKGLFGRTVGVLLALVVLIHGVSGYVFFHHHWPRMRQSLAEALVSQSVLLAAYAQEKGIPQAKQLAKTMPEWAVYQQKQWPPSESLKKPRLLAKMAQGRIPYPYCFAKGQGMVRMWFRLPGKACAGPGPAGLLAANILPGRPTGGSALSAGADGFENARGCILHVCVPARKLVPRSFSLFLSWAVGSSFVFFVVAVFLMRAQVLPLRRLVDWSQTLEKDNPPTLPQIGGAHEIRRIALALARTVDKLHQNYQHRHQVVMGISHDLRTPLARLRLQLAMMGDSAEVQGLRQDVDQLCAMVSHYLDFARQDDEALQTFALEGFLRSWVDGVLAVSPQGVDVFVGTSQGLMACVRPMAIQRGIQNVLNNAVRHCQGRVVVCARFQVQDSQIQRSAAKFLGKRTSRVVRRALVKGFKPTLFGQTIQLERIQPSMTQPIMTQPIMTQPIMTQPLDGLREKGALARGQGDGRKQPQEGWIRADLIIDIMDDGAGVDPSVHASIFEPFFRASEGRSVTNSSSVGLGLAIAQKAAKAHGGQLVLVPRGSAPEGLEWPGSGQPITADMGGHFQFILPNCALIHPNFINTP
jgi:two-component system, OmpR family, osmolarity sensor histidine kinase EnvZ